MSTSTYTGEQLIQMNSEIFRSLMAKFPPRCCVGGTWRLRITNGSTVLVTPYQWRESEQSKQWHEETHTTAL